jgi:4'-phosphopantetheinyl transferase
MGWDADSLYASSGPMMEAMRDVHWLEQTSSDVPSGNEWLSAAERVRMDGFRIEKRRADWRLGRWTAKRAVAALLSLPQDHESLAHIEIHAASSGAPEVFIGNRPASLVLSLSHREGLAACALTSRGTALGCDLELVEPRIDAFVEDYFTPQEQALLSEAPGPDQFPLIVLLWSAKESALKALQQGLRLSTLCLNVALDATGSPSDWHPLQVQYKGHILQGWWQQAGTLVRTVIADPPSPAPVRIHLPS